MGKRGPKKGAKNAGRPRKVLTEEHIRQVKAMAGLGLSLVEICRVLHISHDTIERRKKENEQLLRAWEDGKAEGHAYCANKLRDHIRNGNLNALIFCLRARHKWRDAGDEKAESTQTKTLSRGLSDALKEINAARDMHTGQSARDED